MSKKTVSFQADDDVIAAIAVYAEANNFSTSRAAFELVNHGLDTIESSKAAPAEPEVIPLERIHVDALLGEVGRRFTLAGDKAAELAAIGRADLAESKLEAIRAAFEA